MYANNNNNNNNNNNKNPDTNFSEYDDIDGLV